MLHPSRIFAVLAIALPVLWTGRVDAPAQGERAELLPQVEIRDLAFYESLCTGVGSEEVLS